MAIGCIISGPLTENYGFGLSLVDILPTLVNIRSILDSHWSTNEKTEILNDIAIVCFSGGANTLMGFRKLVYYHTCSNCYNGCLRNKIFREVSVQMIEDQRHSCQFSYLANANF